MAVPMIGPVHPAAYVAHLQLSKPPGTAIAATVRSTPDEARNGLAAQALKFGYDYVFFLDDDMVPEPDLLTHLLKVMEADRSIDILSPFAYRRKPPYWPCVFRKRPDGRYDPVALYSLTTTGLLDVDATTVACTLVRASVFSKFPRPWFRFETRGDVEFAEDVVFCEKAKATGCRIAADAGREVLHLGESALVGFDAFDLVRRNAALQKALRGSEPVHP